MPHKLDLHYSDFGGLDSRSNKLLQNPKFARDGNNFQYNYQDELTKANGFQKKIPAVGSEAGLMEYKYKDINTGESLSQILGIDATGYLNRLRTHRLKLTKAGGSVTNYSVFYDNTGTPSWKIVFYDVTGAVLGSVSFAETVTVLTLKTSINALALTGLTSDVVDEDGVTVGSTTCFAYTLDTVISSVVSTGSVYNPAWYWEQVPCPSASQVPFPNVVAQASNADYEGPTWVSLNNAIYITDGGFPMKYDGYAVYRAGMPRLKYSNGFRGGITDDNSADGQLTGNTNYRYSKQMCFVDPNGVEVCGDMEPAGDIYLLPAGQTEIYLEVPSVGGDTAQSKLFPIYSCKIDGTQTKTGTGSKTITVITGHNVKVGQCLRVPLMNSSNATITSAGLSWAYYEVTAITATTITFNKTISTHYMPLFTAGIPYLGSLIISNASGAGQDGVFTDTMIINAAYVPDDWVGEATDPRNLFGSSSSIVDTTNIQQDWAPTPIYGAFCRLYRSNSNGDTLFRLADVPLIHTEASPITLYHVLDRLPDAANGNPNYTAIAGHEVALTNIPIDDTSGADLPRACSYLSKWQETLIQSGRPIDPQSFLGLIYPTYDGGLNTSGKWSTGLVFPPWYYQENDLCDDQSIYWANPNTPEGFAQDGLHEFLVESSFNDSIRGLCPNKDSFFIFKEFSSGYLTGALAQNNLSLEIMESDAGGVCHKAISVVQGAVMFMDRQNGFWSVVAGKLPVLLGYGIQNHFKNNPLGLNFRKAIADNFALQDKYICFIPGDTSIFFVYDYAQTRKGHRSAWYPWSGVDGTAGVVATADNDLIISAQSSPTLWKQKFTGTKYDYSIHTSAMPFDYKSSFINFGHPVIDKIFHKIWVNSIQGGFTLTVNQYANYIETLLASYDLTFLTEGSSKKAVKDFINVNVDKLSALSVGFSNSTIYEDVKIQGWELEFSADFDLNEGRS